MGAAATVHPTDQTLHSYAVGKLDDAVAESVQKHLSSCPDCLRRIAEMTSVKFAQGQREDQSPPAKSVPVALSLADLSLIDAGANAAGPPSPSTLPPGLAAHPDYQIIRELGQGGMGTVYLAHNRLMDRHEVLKVVSSHLATTSGSMERFLTEVRNAAKLHHPNVVAAYSAFRLGESLVFAMEYVEGRDLSQLVRAKGPLPVANACNYAQQAALGLQHAHEHGMVHRDIKPSNLMLAAQGGRAVIKVLDFGLAKIRSEVPTDATLTRQGQLLGTPDYIAPEQISDARSADIRADIYSLGCTLYYLLTGGPPFPAANLYQLLHAHASADAKPLNLARPEVSIELATLVARMMAKDPERRFQEPKQVVQALMPFFKKGASAWAGSKAEVSHAGGTDAGWPVPTPTKPATDTGGTSVGADKAAIRTIAEGASKSLVKAEEDGRPREPAPAIASLYERVRKKTRIAIAASLFAFTALSVFLIAIRDKGGREMSKTAASNGANFAAGEASDTDDTKSAKASRGEDTSRNRPTSPAGAPETQSVSGRAVSFADALQADSLWKGTTKIMASRNINRIGVSLPLWLTIKERAGDRFKAVADSPWGSHDAQGTLKNGVIQWEVARETFSWEGNLAGDVLKGTFTGDDSAGTRSGEFRLTLADGAQRAVFPRRIPPSGPLRVAQIVMGGHWAVEGNELIRQGLGDGWVTIGDQDWTNYDLSFEALASAGSHAFGANFRISGNGDLKCYVLIFGLGNTHSISRWSRSGGPKEIQSTPGAIQPHQWYNVKVSVRGFHIGIELDGQLLFAVEDEFSQDGCVCLKCYGSAGRFRNIKVTGVDGTVLWEGAPDLP
jgi:hypothetical protein